MKSRMGRKEMRAFVNVLARRKLEEHDQSMWIEDAALHYKYERLRLNTKS